jgi:hypothetical protein
VTQGVGTTKVALGGGEFDAALAPVLMGDAMWPIELLLMRAATTVLALAPLLIALFLFHRFSPDRVRISQAGKRRSPFEVVNTMLKPLSALTAPVFRLAARIGGFPGQVLGDVALTFAAAPMAIVALGASVLVSAVVEAAVIPGVMMAAVTYWGVLVCDLSTRDHAADSEHMAAAVPGGEVRRFLRQYAATVLIGLMFGGVALVRWIDTEPLRAAALAAAPVCSASGPWPPCSGAAAGPRDCSRHCSCSGPMYRSTPRACRCSMRSASWATRMPRRS